MFGIEGRGLLTPVGGSEMASSSSLIADDILAKLRPQSSRFENMAVFLIFDVWLSR